MEVTGGAIRTDKSWRYLVDYVWLIGKWFASDIGLDLNLVTNEVGSNIVSLNHFRCDEGSEMLDI